MAPRPIHHQQLDGLGIRPPGLCAAEAEAVLRPCPAWQARLGHAGAAYAAGGALAADGATLVLAGSAASAPSGAPFAAFAAGFRVADGQRVWTTGLPPTAGQDWVTSVAAVPAGGRVLVGGYGAPGGGTWLAALDAAGGALAWRVAGAPMVPAVAPDGAFLAGGRPGALEARWTADGGLRWQAALPTGASLARAAVAPDGAAVYATGTVPEAGEPARGDLLVVAHRASDGAPLWSKRFDGEDDAGFPVREGGWAVAATPDGQRVVVAGYLAGSEGWGRVLALAAADGALLWSTPLPADVGDLRGFTLAGDGRRAFVAARGGAPDFHVFGLDVLTGLRLWRATYTSPTGGPGDVAALAASPDGTRVYAAGPSADGAHTDVATVAYDALTGAALWAQRHRVEGSGRTAPTSVAVTPDDLRVLVGGYARPAHRTDALALAYDARDLEDLARRALPP